MPIAHEFEYVKPATLEEAVEVLAERPGAQVLAGGTDLVGWLRDEFIEKDEALGLFLQGNHAYQVAPSARNECLWGFPCSTYTAFLCRDKHRFCRHHGVKWQ